MKFTTVALLGALFGVAAISAVPLVSQVGRAQTPTGMALSAARVASKPTKNSTVQPDTCRPRRDPSGLGWIPEGNCSPEIKAQLEHATKSFKQARDFFATGSRTAVAEWHSIQNDSVTCGITPNDRYLTIENAIGKTRYDEPSGEDWKKTGCAATEPVHQAQAQTQLMGETIEAINRETDATANEIKQSGEREKVFDAEHAAWSECANQVRGSNLMMDEVAFENLRDRTCGEEPSQPK